MAKSRLARSPPPVASRQQGEVRRTSGNPSNHGHVWTFDGVCHSSGHQPFAESAALPSAKRPLSPVFVLLPLIHPTVRRISLQRAPACPPSPCPSPARTQKCLDPPPKHFAKKKAQSRPLRRGRSSQAAHGPAAGTAQGDWRCRKGCVRWPTAAPSAVRRYGRDSV